MRSGSTSAWILAAALTTLMIDPVTSPTIAAEFTYSWGHPSPQGNPVYAVVFANDTEGWAVGRSGFVLHTVDGGEHWAFLHGPLAIAPDLYDLVLTSQGTLIACGNGDALYRSLDGGATWQVPSHPNAPELLDLFLLTDGAIFAAGAEGVVLVSTNDGVSWNEVGPGTGTIRHQHWTSSLEGFVVGRNVAHRTMDGGQSWTAFLPLTGFTSYNEVYFTSSSTGYVNEDFALWKTTNSGANWTEHQNFVDPLYRFRTLPLTSDHWLLALLIEGGQLWETTDAGESWTQLYAQGGMGFPCLMQAPGGRVFLGSDLGDILWTDDLGHTVHNATTNLGGEAVRALILAFFQRPDGVIFAANQPTSGETPAWLRSDDGGSTWIIPPTTPGLYWAHIGGFFDNQRGVVGQYEQIRATFDGGASWQNGTLPATYRVTEFAMPAQNRYFAGAYRTSGGGGVFRSTDGGLNWTIVAGGLPPGTVRFVSIDFPTAMIGYAAGQTDAQSNRLYRTSDGGETWQLLSTSGITAPIQSMMWFDSQRGVIAQTWEEPGIRRTTDGGLTWNEVSSFAAVRFTRRDASEAVGLMSYDDTFALTSDAGLTWEEIHVPVRGGLPELTDYLGAVTPIDGGWVIGAGGNKILVATEQPTTGVPGQDTDGLSGSGGGTWDTLRVYAAPNPTRWGAEIQLELPSAGSVHVSVHEANGRRIATLLERFLPPGKHRVTWTGQDDSGLRVAAGVYFARLSGIGGIRTSKITVAR